MLTLLTHLTILSPFYDKKKGEKWRPLAPATHVRKGVNRRQVRQFRGKPRENNDIA
jgi:hypothetical protein